MKFMVALGILALSVSAQAQKKIAYSELFELSSLVNIETVEVVSVGLNDQSKYTQYPLVIELKILGTTGCNAKLLAVHNSDTLRLSLIDTTGFSVDSACDHEVQYLWTPANSKLKIGESEIKILHVLSARGGVSYDVKATVTRRQGAWPNGNGGGTYYEYSNVSVSAK